MTRVSVTIRGKGDRVPQSFGSLHCHFVFSTKQRKNLINDDLEPRLFAYIGGILRNHSCSLIDAGGMPDHVHLLVSVGRTMSAAEVVKLVKSNSSSWIHEEVRLPQFQWQAGYGAFAVSYSMIDNVKAYLSSQKDHHKRTTFQDEFRELLRRHNLEWDEQYAWD